MVVQMQLVNVYYRAAFPGTSAALQEQREPLGIYSKQELVTHEMNLCVWRGAGVKQGC